MGINTAMLPSARGIGFAVPAQTASWVAAVLIQHGEVRRPYLGIVARGEELAAGARARAGQARAVRVVRVEPGTPAAAGGLSGGDLLLAANERAHRHAGRPRARAGAGPPRRRGRRGPPGGRAPSPLRAAAGPRRPDAPVPVGGTPLLRSVRCVWGSTSGPPTPWPRSWTAGTTRWCPTNGATRCRRWSPCARADGALTLGQDALQVERRPRAGRSLRSFKRLLADAGPLTEVEVGGALAACSRTCWPAYFERLREDIVSRSNAGVGEGETLEIAVSVPANASQRPALPDPGGLPPRRLRGAGAAERALRGGVRVRAPLPQHRDQQARVRARLRPRRGHVRLLAHPHGRARERGHHHRRRGAAGRRRPRRGDPRARARQARGTPDIDAHAWRRLLDECRRQKEGDRPQHAPPRRGPGARWARPRSCCRWTTSTRRARRSSPGRWRPWTRSCATRGATRTTVGWNELAGIYVVGGASSFPLVYRQLRERFGQHRVRRSPHPFAATAIGLANFLDDEAGYELSDCLTRHFGVWREAEHGPRGRLRPHLRQGHAPAARGRAAAGGGAPVPPRAQPRPLPLRGVRQASARAGRTATSRPGTRSASRSIPRCATAATWPTSRSAARRRGAGDRGALPLHLGRARSR